MAQLSLTLFGGFDATLGGTPVTDFVSNKVRALLAFLAVESGRVHRRESLATLLWPGYPDRSARTNLRNALANLRTVIGDREAEPPFLLISRETLQFNRESDYWLDVEVFSQTQSRIDQAPTEQLAEAASFYAGDFLAGFTLTDAVGFDDWTSVTGERLQQQALDLVARLVDRLEAAGELDRALAYARRRVELEPWLEAAQRQLIRLLAQTGRRSAALRQYRQCLRILEEELGAAPAAATTALYEEIRSSAGRELPIPSAPPRALEVRPPSFLDPGAPQATVRAPIFVGRAPELARLTGYLGAALAGQGQVAFVVGGPGRGKTALMRAFGEQAMAAHPDLLVVSGGCNDYSGVGDAYLPFREALGMLTGDVESRWRAGRVSREHARRLWSALPVTLAALVAHGPHVIDSFVSSTGVMSRAEQAGLGDAPWMVELRTLSDRSAGGGLEQQALFQQVMNTLQAVAVARPLLLVLDDLQWMDQGSIGLLFHLGRRLAGCRILVVGAYRPEEVAAGRLSDGVSAPHRLTKTLNEFRRDFGDVWVDLRQADESEGRQFVDALVATENNRLGEAFRAALYERTGGHPLFTIELMRALQARGDLLLDAGGAWVEGESLDWTTLPARVEAVIEERLGRLTAQQRDLLAVASVEGETFTVEILAQVEDLTMRSVLRTLRRDLASRHRLVREVEGVPANGGSLSRFEFVHALFQEHLHSELATGERCLIHGEVAAALEMLYGSASDRVAVQLAHHYDAAGITEKAIDYAVVAGDQARASHANDEAKRYYERALVMLEGFAGTKRSARRRVAALTGSARARFHMGEVPQAGEHFRAAIDLGRESGVPVEELALLYYWLAKVLYWQERYEERHRLGQEGLALFGADETSLGAVLMRHIMATDFDVDHQSVGVSALGTANSVQDLPYVEELAWVYGNFVDISMQNGDVAAALAWIGKLEGCATQSGDLQALGNTHSLMADVLAAIGDFDGCIRRQHERLSVAVRIGDVKGESWALNYLACQYFVTGDAENSAIFAAKSLQLAKRLAYRPYIYYGYVTVALAALCREDWQEAIRLFLLAEQVYREEYNSVARCGLGWAYLGTGDRLRARRWFEEHLIAMAESGVTERPQLFNSLLAGMERIYDDLLVFRVWCERFQAAHPQSTVFLSQWSLIPSSIRATGDPPDFTDEFTVLSPVWAWEDGLGDSEYVVDDGLMITAVNGRWLDGVNLSAPRMMLPASPDSAGSVAQVTCEPVLDDRPANGGLLLWQDRENYLWLEVGRYGESVVGFGGCLANRDVVIGRGLLPGGARLWGGPGMPVTLRLERAGQRVGAFCSLDGDAWFSVGHVEFPVGGALQIGVHAIGQGAWPVVFNPCIEGSAIRFRSFKLWAL